MLDHKLFWVIVPLLGYGLIALAPPLRRRLSRHTLNVHVSLLLLAYLSVTAGLGVFWVANQQLPVFDWHYLFGYATMLLVALHLSFNLRIVLRSFRKTRAPTKQKKGSERGALTTRRGAVNLVLVSAGVLAAFGLGMRHGATEVRITTGGDTPALRANDLVRIVEQYHEFASSTRSGVFARAAGVDWGPKPAAFKSYPSLPARPLRTEQAADLAGRSLSVALREPADLEATVRWQTVGAMLFHTVGITSRRSGWALRAAPSSGALFPTELYVRVDSVEGIDRGLYHYDPQTEHLSRLDHRGLASLGLISTLPAAQNPITVVLTSVFRRTGHKYRDRAYRYAVADAGHALENLRVAASEAGLFASPALHFDESVASRELGLDAREEGVLAVVQLESVASPRSLPNRGDFTTALARPPDNEALGVTGWVHRATSLELNRVAAKQAGFELSPATFADKQALETIRARRSQRRFNEEPLAENELSSLLADMHARAPLLSRAVRVHVIVNRVSGLEPGVYRYRDKGHRLSLSRKGQLAQRAQSVALEQEVIGRSAAVFVFTVDRDEMFSQGARGYRHAFLETGLMGERLLLSAVARGLGACPVGAFYDDEAGELLKVDAQREWVVHFAGVGRL